jgi:Putative beta-barrel porin 2
MTNCKALSGPFLILATALICFSPHSVRATDVEVSTSSSEAESKSVPLSELGTGNFSRLPFHLSASVSSGYDDNVTGSNLNPQGSPFTSGNLGLTYDFGSPRTQLSLGAGAGLTYYWDHIQNAGVNTNNYDTNDYLNFSLTHKASPRLTLSTIDYLTYQSEPDFSIGQGVNRRSGNFFFTQDKFSVAYLWTPRFSTVTSYTVTALNYDDIAVGVFEDRFENMFGNEFRFLIWPTTSLVGEYRFQIVSYLHDGDVIVPATFALVKGVPVRIPPVRLHQDSTTQFLLAGFDHSFNPRLNVSFRGGAQLRDPEQGGEESSPYFEGTLTYVLSKQTSVSWTNHYGLEEPDVANSQRRKAFRTGLSAKHDFTARISGTLGAYYENADYLGTISPGVVNPSFTEQSFDLAVSFRYAITRSLGVEAGYNYTDVSSDIPLREYSRNHYWGGLNFKF